MKNVTFSPAKLKVVALCFALVAIACWLRINSINAQYQVLTQEQHVNPTGSMALGLLGQQDIPMRILWLIGIMAVACFFTSLRYVTRAITGTVLGGVSVLVALGGFLSRTYFASELLGAHVLFDTPVGSEDAKKISAIAIGCAVLLVIGLVILLVGAVALTKSSKSRSLVVQRDANPS